MALKSILDSLDELPDELKSEYKAQKIGDKDVFVLDVEGIEVHPGTKGLKATLDKTKKDLKEMKSKLDTATTSLTGLPEDFSKEEWDRLKALEENNENPDLKKLKETYDSQLQAIKLTHKNELNRLKADSDAAVAAKEAEVALARVARADDHTDVELTNHLVKAGVRPELMNAAKALHKSKFKHEFEDNGQFRTFRETDTGEQTVEEFVTAWVGSDEGKAFIAPASGGGSGGGNRPNGFGSPGDNPFSKGAWNKTKQGELYKNNRVQAERLAKSAGFANLSVAITASSAIGAKEGVNT